MTAERPLQGDDIFVGNSEMAQVMRQHDWASTPLGSPQHWPNALKVALRLLLTSRFEMWLGWGPDLAFFYNDAYRPTLGNKHPQALARPTRLVWPEIWDDVKDRLAAVYERGESTWDEGLLLLVNRHGYPEESYHTFSYSPLLDDDGHVRGTFCAVSEETGRVINERRLALLRDLASRLAVADSRTAVLAAAADSLSANAADLTFTLGYRFNAEGQARLAFATGLPAGSVQAPATLDADCPLWALHRIWQGQDSATVPLSQEHNSDNTAAPPTPLPATAWGPWTMAPAAAIVVPLPGQGSEKPMGALVVGLNPYRAFDDDYLGFVKLLAGQLSSSLANAEVFDDERRNAAALAEAARLRQEAAEALGRDNERLVGEVEARTAERDRLHQLFQQAPSFMCLLQGPDHVVGLVNDAYMQLVGHRDLLGMPVRQALPEVEGQGLFELLDEVYRSGKPFLGRNLAVQLQRAAGAPMEERYLTLVFQPLQQDNRVVGIFVDGYDVTQQKHAEDSLQALNSTLEERVALRTGELAQALVQLRRESGEREAAQHALRQAQRMEAIGALTGGIAHDFNNLLQVISGNIQLLSKYVSGNAVAEKRARSALAGVSRGAKLASQLLAFGRRQPLEPKVVNIGRLVRSVDDMLRRALGEEVEIECVIQGGLWNTLVDPGQIENAILNLAINARDAMDGGGRLTIEAGNAHLDDEYARLNEDVAAGQYVLLAVTDTGSGIAPEIIDRVFEPFFSTKPEGKGTGLGLSMVYGFVKQSGGHIKIYSELGEGTTIKIYLPRVMQPEDKVADPAGVPTEGGRETVLVVEDDADVRDTTVSIVADLGYRVLNARDAASALTVLESGVPVDLLFTDVVMPGPLRSPELARKARELLPDIRVLFTSGYTQNAIVHGGRLDPGVELLSKPYTREALARKLRQVLGHRTPLHTAPPSALVPSLAGAPQQYIHSPASGAAPADGLPLRPTERTAGTIGSAGSANKVPSATRNTQAQRRLTVLLVEDDELIRQTTAEMLADDGHLVLEAGDGPAALKALAAQPDGQPVQLLLADVGLPGGMSGGDLARLAVQQWPALQVVFATGEARVPPEAGMDDALVLPKPYQHGDLVRMLATVTARLPPPAAGSGSVTRA